MGTTNVTGPLLRPVSAAKYLGISRSQLYRLTQQGRLPTSVKLGRKAVGFPQSALDDFISQCAAAQQEIIA